MDCFDFLEKNKHFIVVTINSIWALLECFSVRSLVKENFQKG